jgi:hypothetical protein
VLVVGLAKGSSYLFEGALHDVADGGDFLGLTDTVDAVERLILAHGIPLGLHDVRFICNGQVEACGS